MMGPRLGGFLVVFPQKAAFMMISAFPEAIVGMFGAFGFCRGKAVSPWLEGDVPRMMFRIERINHG